MKSLKVILVMKYSRIKLTNQNSKNNIRNHSVIQNGPHEKMPISEEHALFKKYSDDIPMNIYKTTK